MNIVNHIFIGHWKTNKQKFNDIIDIENDENFYFEDNPYINIIPHCEKIYPILCECENEILICCHAAKSRSPSIIIYYLMFAFEMSFNDAHKFILQKKPDIDLNFGFYEKLKNLNYNSS
jgi:hypothetical protein